MCGPTIDRAADRLTVSGWALADLPALRLAHLLLYADLTQAEYHAAKDELRRRKEHATREEDLADIALLVNGKGVTL